MSKIFPNSSGSKNAIRPRHNRRPSLSHEFAMIDKNKRQLSSQTVIYKGQVPNHLIFTQKVLMIKAVG